jgi:PAS domain S-box-containing protein
MVMTFAEVAEVPGKGECCVVLVPRGETVFSEGLAAAVRVRKGSRTVRLPEGRPPSAIRTDLLTILRSPPANLLVDAGALGARQGADLLLALADTLRKRKVRSWWLLPQSLLDHRAAADVKRRAEVFAVVRDSAIQFVAAQNIVDPEFFLPKLLVTDPAAIPPVPPSPLESIVAELPAAVAVFDADGKPLLANTSSVREFGMDVSTLEQRSLFALVAKDSARHLLRCLSSLNTTGSAEGTLTLIDRQRRRRSVELKATRLQDGRTVCLVRESDQASVMHELTTEVELLTSLLEEGPAVQAVFRGAKLVRAGGSFRDLVDWLGVAGEFDMNSLLGKRGVELRRMLADQGSASAEICLRNREGEERRFEFSASMVRRGKQTLTHVSLHDITDREKAARRLEESEGLARELASATAAGLIVLRDGRCHSANRAALEMLGFGTTADLADREFTELCGTRYREQVREGLVGDAGDRTFEIRMVQKDGGSLAVDLRIRPVSGGHACILHDVTPMRKLKTDLRRAHQQREIFEPFMRSLAGLLDPVRIAETSLENLQRELGFEGGVVLLFRDGRGTVAASRGISEKVSAMLASQSPDEGVPAYMAKTLEPLVTAVTSYPAFLPLRALWEGEGYATVAYVPLTTGGTLFGLQILLGTRQEVGEDWPWLFGSIGVLLGESLGVSFAFADLRAQEQTYRSIVCGLPDVAYRCGANGSVDVLSPRMETLFGHKTAEFQHDPEFWRSLVHPDDRAMYSRRISGQHEGTEGVELYYRMLPRGKAVYRWVRDQVRFDRAPDGTVEAIVGILTIVAGPPAQAGTGVGDTAPAGQPQGGAPARQHQEDEFASIVSHDLKESLITIEAYSRIVREEAKLQPEMAEHLDRVVAASGRLKNLIDDLATLSRVGRDIGAHQTFPLHKVFEELEAEFEPILRLRNARLVIPAEAPVVAYDRTQLTMVLRNLISNGLKFNRDPEPAVEITVQEREGEVTVAVHDNGIGIAAEDRERVFVIFKRLNPSSEFPGTGAGLAIVQRIVERHGGRIWVESGAGSTFSFTIPSRRSVS